MRILRRRIRVIRSIVRLLLASAVLGTQHADAQFFRSAAAQQPRNLAASAQAPAKVQRFTQVALSPDGLRLAWVGPAGRGPTRDISGAVLAVQSNNWSADQIVLPGDDHPTATEVRWTRDSKALAILASTGKGQMSVFVMRGAEPARRVVNIKGAVHGMRWSLDDTRIALLYSAADEQANSPTAPTPRDTGVMDTHIDRQHLAIVDVNANTFKSLSQKDVYVYEFDWSPDGKQLVVIHANGSGNNNWWVAKLSTLDASSGAMKELAAPKTQIAVPRWSFDGTQISFIGGLMSDQGVTGGDVYVMPAAGGVPRNLTPRGTTSISQAGWISPTTLIATGYAQGQTQLATIDVKTGAVTPKWTVDEHISASVGNNATISATIDGQTLAVVRESFTTPPEIWVGPPSKLVQITHINDRVKATMAKATSVKWKSDSFNVQGFLLFPPGYDAAKKYPMIVQVHGGPSSSVKPGYVASDSYEALELAAGYVVFLPNPRGSYGQGEAFVRANVKDFGHGDLKDIMAGVDEVLKQNTSIDGTRMGIRGWSYGGFMTMWAVTQTNRFKAAVAGAGISNWLSYTGQNGISEWMVPFFGATAYENKAVYEKSSPINFIAQAKTPTLVVVGERDAECPAPQSVEFWRGLQHVGVPTQLVIYPDEGHAIGNPDHVRDLRERTVKWMDMYLKPPKA